ncbi:hypothetical protein TNCV_2897991 [Trichonephila clavipes]|nr:hypothetical protein TNCV_2897991 [Trichonephila clavipes]
MSLLWKSVGNFLRGEGSQVRVRCVGARFLFYNFLPNEPKNTNRAPNEIRKCFPLTEYVFQPNLAQGSSNKKGTHNNFRHSIGL